MTAEAIEAGPRTGDAGRDGRAPAAHRAPHLQGEPVLRRPGRLRPPPLARARPPRPQRRGHRRPALPRARRGRPAHRARQPRPLPLARPVPHARQRDEYRDWIDAPGGRHHVHRRLPRAADLLAARPAPPGRPAGRVRRRPRQPDPRLRAARRRRRAPGHHDPPPHHRRPPARTGRGPRLEAPRSPCAAGTASRGCRSGSPAGCPPCSPSPAPPAARSSTTSACARTASTSCTSAPTPASCRPDPAVAEVPGRIVTTSSADVPLKGLVFLVEALAKVRTEHPDAHLVVVGKRAEDGPVAQAIEKYGLGDAVEFVKGITDAELVDLVRSAQVACVPSLYEGFSLPAAEAMATGTPLLATTGGAIPEVAGPDGETCLAVPPGDAGALAARPRPAARRRGAARAARRGRPRTGPGTVHLGPRRPGHRRALPRGHRRPRAVSRPGSPPGDRAPRAHDYRPLRGHQVDLHPRKGRPRADRRLLPLPARPGRPRARPGLRRGPARLRVLPARRPGRGPRPERRGDPRGRQVVRRDEGGRRGARGRHRHRHGGRRAQPALPRRVASTS